MSEPNPTGVPSAESRAAGPISNKDLAERANAIQARTDLDDSQKLSLMMDLLREAAATGLIDPEQIRNVVDDLKKDGREKKGFFYNLGFRLGGLARIDGFFGKSKKVEAQSAPPATDKAKEPGFFGKMWDGTKTIYNEGKRWLGEGYNSLKERWNNRKVERESKAPGSQVNQLVDTVQESAAGRGKIEAKGLLEVLVKNNKLVESIAISGGVAVLADALGLAGPAVGALTMVATELRRNSQLGKMSEEDRLKTITQSFADFMGTKPYQEVDPAATQESQAVKNEKRWQRAVGAGLRAFAGLLVLPERTAALFAVKPNLAHERLSSEGNPMERLFKAMAGGDQIKMDAAGIEIALKEVAQRVEDVTLMKVIGFDVPLTIGEKYQKLRGKERNRLNPAELKKQFDEVLGNAKQNAANIRALAESFRAEFPTIHRQMLELADKLEGLAPEKMTQTLDTKAKSLKNKLFVSRMLGLAAKVIGVKTVQEVGRQYELNKEAVRAEIRAEADQARLAVKPELNPDVDKITIKTEPSLEVPPRSDLDSAVADFDALVNRTQQEAATIRAAAETVKVAGYDATKPFWDNITRSMDDALRLPENGTANFITSTLSRDQMTEAAFGNLVGNGKVESVGQIIKGLNQLRETSPVEFNGLIATNPDVNAIWNLGPAGGVGLTNPDVRNAVVARAQDILAIDTDNTGRLDAALNAVNNALS